ncbi:Ribonuclease H [Desulfosarcina cetonica]|uniref:ribonuclease HI n=1 Tax=Desulfosarcina cetonica TaxID=90730 RepID=UPI0006CFE424|nr:ribonuclease HI [Desulfosarcina cetonica]VTR65576.1 Ribonuclease H [Desulfosarcina cetonica]
MPIKKYYAVAVGRQPGIYTQWFGPAGAKAQVDGVVGARYKGFPTIEEARAFVEAHRDTNNSGRMQPGKPSPKAAKAKAAKAKKEDSTIDLGDRIVVYTDGSSLGNPGPGGYGVVIPTAGGDREFSAGYRRTTNNRMELMACIVGLEQLDPPTAVALYSDSRYVVDGITKGWARNWRRRGWRKSNGEPALNVDLWSRLLDLCERHDVMFVWVKGHAGNPGNERCDQLATRAAGGAHLMADIAYEGGGN